MLNFVFVVYSVVTGDSKRFSRVTIGSVCAVIAIRIDRRSIARIVDAATTLHCHCTAKAYNLLSWSGGANDSGFLFMFNQEYCGRRDTHIKDTVQCKV